jgi:hypothetical protein
MKLLKIFKKEPQTYIVGTTIDNKTTIRATAAVIIAANKIKRGN